MPPLCCTRCCWGWGASNDNSLSSPVTLQAEGAELQLQTLSQSFCLSFKSAISKDDEPRIIPVLSNFNELLSCDATSKHHFPISMPEFKILDELMTEPSSTWSVVIRKPGVEVQQKLDKSSPCILIRCFCEYDNVIPEAFLYNLVETEQRMAWDNMFTDFRVLETCAEGKDFVYFVLPSPAPLVAARDFVLHRRVASETTVDGKRYDILQRSAVHAAMPVNRGVIRAENMIGGYSISQKSGSSKTSLFVTTMSDPKGNVPARVVNMMASKKLLSWLECLHRAAKESRDAEMLESWAQKCCEVCGDDVNIN